MHSACKIKSHSHTTEPTHKAAIVNTSLGKIPLGAGLYCSKNPLTEDFAHQAKLTSSQSEKKSVQLMAQKTQVESGQSEPLLCFLSNK